MGTRWSDGYSSDIKIDLLVGGERYAIEQIGPEWFIVRDEARVPEGFAQISIRIDSHEELLDVVLLEPISGAYQTVLYRKRAFHAGLDEARQPA